MKEDFLLRQFVVWICIALLIQIEHLCLSPCPGWDRAWVMGLLPQPKGVCLQSSFCPETDGFLSLAAEERRRSCLWVCFLLTFTQAENRKIPKILYGIILFTSYLQLLATGHVYTTKSNAHTQNIQHIFPLFMSIWGMEDAQQDIYFAPLRTSYIGRSPTELYSKRYCKETMLGYIRGFTPHIL